MTLDERKSYRGTWKGVNFEICSFQSRAMPEIDIPAKTNWTYYLIIQIGRLPEALRDQYWLKVDRKELTPGSGRFMCIYNEYDSPLGNLPWHGGITWYSKESTEDNTPEERVIKAGCDYQHYADEGREYTLEWVLEDVKECIEAFKEQVPGYKWHCPMVGGYWDASEGEVSEDGQKFISNKGKQYRIDQGYDKPKESTI